jgi:hypothetical protein
MKRNMDLSPILDTLEKCGLSNDSRDGIPIYIIRLISKGSTEPPLKETLRYYMKQGRIREYNGPVESLGIKASKKEWTAAYLCALIYKAVEYNNDFMYLHLYEVYNHLVRKQEKQTAIDAALYAIGWFAVFLGSYIGTSLIVGWVNGFFRGSDSK